MLDIKSLGLVAYVDLSDYAQVQYIKISNLKICHAMSWL